METEERWQMIEAERLSLADLLESLSPDQWEAQSLCTEWRVRDVAAHVAMTPAGLGWWPILTRRREGPRRPLGVRARRGAGARRAARRGHRHRAAARRGLAQHAGRDQRQEHPARRDRARAGHRGAARDRAPGAGRRGGGRLRAGLVDGLALPRAQAAAGAAARGHGRADRRRRGRGGRGARPATCCCWPPAAPTPPYDVWPARGSRAWGEVDRTSGRVAACTGARVPSTGSRAPR